MRNKAVILGRASHGILLFLLALVVGCTTASTPTPTRAPSPTPTATTRATATPTGTPACMNADASVQLSGSSTTVRVGQVVTVTVVATNTGCLLLGLPQYSLYLQADQPQPLFDPSRPDPVVHSSIALGESDTAQFVLRAVRAGEATVNAVVSYEVHVGYPGPAYWRSSASAIPLRILVAP